MSDKVYLMTVETKLATNVTLSQVLDASSSGLVSDTQQAELRKSYRDPGCVISKFTFGHFQ